jgi:hypothetical protein
MGLFDKVTKSVSDMAASAGTSAVQTASIKKAEMELADLNNKYDECHIIIGKRIAEFMRNGEEISDVRVKEAFDRIVKFDEKKSELEAKLRELKGEKEFTTEAIRLVEAEEAAEKEIAKCKELLEMGVDTQEEYDRKVGALRNKVDYFKQLAALEKAMAKKLISEDEYKAKKAAILGRDVIS